MSDFWKSLSQVIFEALFCSVDPYQRAYSRRMQPPFTMFGYQVRGSTFFFWSTKITKLAINLLESWSLLAFILTNLAGQVAWYRICGQMVSRTRNHPTYPIRVLITSCSSHQFKCSCRLQRCLRARTRSSPWDPSWSPTRDGATGARSTRQRSRPTTACPRQTSRYALEKREIWKKGFLLKHKKLSPVALLAPALL